MTTVEASRIVSFGLLVLIWMVQLVVYPAFLEIAPERFTAWHARYTRAVTWIVAPLMLAQAALLGWLLFDRPSLWLGLTAGMVAIAWAATFAMAVPAHDTLQVGGRDVEVIRRLISTNWVRTIAWTFAFLFDCAA